MAALAKILAKTSTLAGEMVYSFRDMTIALQEVGLDFCRLATFEEKNGDQQHGYNCKVSSTISRSHTMLAKAVSPLPNRGKILAYVRLR